MIFMLWIIINYYYYHHHYYHDNYHHFIYLYFYNTHTHTHTNTHTHTRTFCIFLQSGTDLLLNVHVVTCIQIIRQKLLRVCKGLRVNLYSMQPSGDMAQTSWNVRLKISIHPCDESLGEQKWLIPFQPKQKRSCPPSTLGLWSQADVWVTAFRPQPTRGFSVSES